MLFIVTNTFGTANWYYAASRTEPAPPARSRLERPTGFAEYPAHELFVEDVLASRSIAKLG
jgi:hypothetical protein